MIEILAGKIGGGKTYSAVKWALDHLAAGGTVFTNIEFNREGVERFLERRYGVYFEQDQIRTLEPAQIPEFHKHIQWGDLEGGLPVLVIIDEAHIHFNARAWKDASQDFLNWLTQSRKTIVDIYLIAQSEDTIDKQLRLQAQFVWMFRDMNRTTIPFMGPWPLPMILQKKYDYEDRRKSCEHHWLMKDKMIFDAYNTYAFLDPENMKDQAEQRKNAIKKRQLKKVGWKRKLNLYWNPLAK